MHVYLNNQYDKLIYYLMSYPYNFNIINPANPNKGKINYPLLYSQYNNFVNILIENDIKVQFLNSVKSPSEVFTRDIGFVIKDILFISKLKSSERINEPNTLKKFAKIHNLKTYEMNYNIEGGDIILHDDVVFVGMSRRSTRESCSELQSVLDEYKISVKVIPINFDNKKLHLDCVFNSMDKDNCIITDYVFDKDIIYKHFKNCIPIKGEIASKLGSNFVCLGNKKIISSSKDLCNLLNSYGYFSIYSDYSEIEKAGGSFTCSTLPILRI